MNTHAWHGKAPNDAQLELAQNYNGRRIRLLRIKIVDYFSDYRILIFQFFHLQSKNNEKLHKYRK
jgi:hypothetical protein